MTSQIFRSRSIATAIVMTSMVGCGGSQPVKPPQVIKPVNVVTSGVTAQPENRSSASPVSANTSTSRKSTSTKPPIPDGTDPKDIFEIDSDGLPMTVNPPVSQLPEETFEVVVAEKGVDSSQFVVAAVSTSEKSAAPRTGFSLPKGFVADATSGYSPEGLPLRVICEKSGTMMALVPAGVFRMGASEAPAECQPEFSLFLDAFYMDVFEVTVGQFEKYRQEMKESKKPVPTISNGTASETTPVLGVPWGIAQGYARWLDLDLPTEAQFEKAARGNGNFRTPWGDGRAIWPGKRTPDTISPVGSYSSDCSSYGIYDLAGNAREWCSDLYSEKSHRDAFASSSETPRNWPGPKKVSNMNLRAVKGNGPDWSAWHRQGRDIGKSFADIGFRCVLKITVPETK